MPFKGYNIICDSVSKVVANSYDYFCNNGNAATSPTNIIPCIAAGLQFMKTGQLISHKQFLLLIKILYCKASEGNY